MSEKIKALLERRDHLRYQVVELSKLIDEELTAQVDVHRRQGGYTRVVLLPHVVKDALARTRGVYQQELSHIDVRLKQMETLL